MNKISILLMALLTGALITSGIFFTKTRALQKQKLQSELSISFLKSQINDLESRVSDLEEEKEKLEDKLSEVKHFDEDNFSSSTSGVSYTGDAYKGTIDGEFTGWEGSTVFQMMDGSIWKQAAYDYLYHYAYMPQVLIYKKNGSYYMKVEDVDDEVEVERIR